MTYIYSHSTFLLQMATMANGMVSPASNLVKRFEKSGLLPSLISLQCMHEETMSPYLPIDCTMKTGLTGLILTVI